MVDDRDLAGPMRLSEVLGAAIDPAAAPSQRCDARGLRRRRRRRISASPRAVARRRVSSSRRGGGRAPTRRPRRASATARRPRVTVDDRHARVRPRCVASVAPPCLLHHDLRVGERRHLREVGDAQHLVRAAQRRERAPDREAGLAADPGVDLVEHQRRRRFGEHRRAAPASRGRARRRTRPWRAAGPARPGSAPAGT